MLVGYVLAVGLGFALDWLWFFGAGHPLHGFWPGLYSPAIL